MNLKEQLQSIINNKTKPIGSLGQLETIALQVGLIQQTINPSIRNAHIIIFAADHGIATTGLVNPYPQAVTAQMVLNFLTGGAAINVFTRKNNIGLTVVDAGVNYMFDKVPEGNNFISAKVNYGTKNYLEEDALTTQEVEVLITKGKELIAQLAVSGCNCVGFGEMGISNTSCAALIMSAITGLSVEECTGKGTGLNTEQLHGKIETLKKVYAKHQLQSLSKQPVNLLSKIGGSEVVMMTGAYLEAAKRNMIIVVDGFISTAALLVALQMEPSIINNCIFAHTSGEQGHEKMLRFLGVQPLLNLQMRLGEGTGAALAIPIIENALAFLNEMASFESANVSGAIK